MITVTFFRWAVLAALTFSFSVGWLSFSSGNPWWIACCQAYLCLLLLSLLLFFACRVLSAPAGLGLADQTASEKGGQLDITIGDGEGQLKASASE